jgi:hypothetical protein
LRPLRFLKKRGAKVPNVTLIDNGTGQIERYTKLSGSAFPGIEIDTVPADARKEPTKQPKRLRIDRYY